MAKIIAICGAPGSGKTTVAFKLAQEVYLSTSDCSVTFISPDITVPTIGMLFPNYKPDSLFSLSSVLDSTDISSDLLLENLVTVKNMKNFGCLGFKSGDSKYSFPTPTKEKVKNLLDVLAATDGYVFVDCTNEDTDLISKQALARADHIIQVITPDLKSMTWLNSYGDKIITSGTEQSLKVINITEHELYSQKEAFEPTSVQIFFAQKPRGKDLLFFPLQFCFFLTLLTLSFFPILYVLSLTKNGTLDTPKGEKSGRSSCLNHLTISGFFPIRLHSVGVIP